MDWTDYKNATSFIGITQWRKSQQILIPYQGLRQRDVLPLVKGKILPGWVKLSDLTDVILQKHL